MKIQKDMLVAYTYYGLPEGDFESLGVVLCHTEPEPDEGRSSSNVKLIYPPNQEGKVVKVDWSCLTILLQLQEGEDSMGKLPEAIFKLIRANRGLKKVHRYLLEENRSLRQTVS